MSLTWITCLVSVLVVFFITAATCDIMNENRIKKLEKRVKELESLQ